MSYSIHIGQAVIDSSDDDLDVTVLEISNADAPCFVNDTATAKSNGRHPSYGAWDAFCKETGLKGLFKDEETGLMRNHPGCSKLKPEHLETVAAALASWRRRYPIAKPGFEGDSYDAERVDAPGVDPVLARLIWLEFWMRWTLENCTIPAVANR